MDVESYLQSLKGVPESDGGFTIDPTRRREAMERLHRAQPFAFLLKLVQWAMACADGLVDLYFQPGFLRISFESARMPARGLGQAVERLGLQTSARLTGPGQMHLYHALLLLQGQGESRLTVDFGGEALDYRAGKVNLRVFCADEVNLPGFRASRKVVARLSRSQRPRRPSAMELARLDLLSPFLSAFWPEWYTVNARILHAPVALAINGRKWSPPKPRKSFQPSCVYGLARRGAQRGRIVDTLSLTMSRSCLDFSLEPPSRIAFDALYVLRYAPLPEESQPPWIFLQDGVVVDTVIPSGLPRWNGVFLEAYVNYDELEVDASMLTAVRNEVWQAAFQQVERDVQWFAERCVSELPASIKRSPHLPRADGAMLTMLQKHSHQWLARCWVLRTGS